MHFFHFNILIILIYKLFLYLFSIYSEIFYFYITIYLNNYFHFKTRIILSNFDF